MHVIWESPSASRKPIKRPKDTEGHGIAAHDLGSDGVGFQWIVSVVIFSGYLPVGGGQVV